MNRLVDGFDYNSEPTSAELVSITSDLIQQTKDFMNRALEDTHIQHGDVDEVVLLDGSTNLVSV